MSQENPEHCINKQLDYNFIQPSHNALQFLMKIEFTSMKQIFFKDLNDVPPSYDWFPYEYIDAEVNKKVDETKGQLADNEMDKETKHYVESLNQNHNWLKKITIEIDKFLIDHEYIEFFMQMCMQLRKDNGSTSSFQKLIIPRLPCF